MEKQLKIYNIYGKSLISTRELCDCLEVGYKHATWVNNKIRSHKLVEGFHYICETEEVKSGLKKTYYFDIDIVNKIVESMRTNRATIDTMVKLKGLLLSEEEEVKDAAIEPKEEELDTGDEVTAISETSAIPYDDIASRIHVKFGEIRFVTIDGKDFAVGTDIARALGYKFPSATISKKCKTKLKRILERFDKESNKKLRYVTTLISEGDIYRLIAGSQLPAAEKFESWIFDEVIPNIRKHGVYATETTLENMLNDPDYAIGLLKKYKEEKEEKQKLLAESIKNQPKITAYDDFMDSEDLYTINEVVKMLRIPRTPISEDIIGKNTFLAWLRRDNILMSCGADRNTPQQKYIERGYFKVNAYNNFPSTARRITPLVTTKGIEWLYKRYKYSKMPKDFIESNIDSIKDFS